MAAECLSLSHSLSIYRSPGTCLSLCLSLSLSVYLALSLFVSLCLCLSLSGLERNRYTHTRREHAYKRGHDRARERERAREKVRERFTGEKKGNARELPFVGILLTIIRSSCCCVGTESPQLGLNDLAPRDTGVL